MKNVTLSFIFLMLLAGSLHLPAQETKAVDLMSKALYEENINADFNKASLIYQQVVKDFSQDKKACAQATYRLGLCSEKLGQAKAQEYFISVIENYSDQQELVALARAKLNNSNGVKYFTDERDGKSYKFVTVGRQGWMAENLAYMPHVSSVSEQGGIWVYGYNGHDVTEASKTENYLKYGNLYDLRTALVSCPKGWHLPTHIEWSTLEKYIGFEDPESNDDKVITKGRTIFEYVTSPDDWGPNYQNNFTGLSLLPGGLRLSGDIRDPRFISGSRDGFYLSSSKESSDAVWIRTVDDNILGYARMLEDYSSAGLSVRCIQDNPILRPVEAHPLRLIEPTENEKVIGLCNIKVSVNQKDLVDSVKLFYTTKGGFKLICTDFSKYGAFGRFSGQWYQLPWDTRQFKDGNYNLTVIAYHFGGYQDSIHFKLEVANDYPVKKDGEFVDSRDGKNYPFIHIGNQTWMAKNLDHVIKDGTGSFCFNDLVSNCITYGRLYDFETALNACPEGWHLPSDAEWIEMEKYLGMADSVIFTDRYGNDQTGRKLKSATDWGIRQKSSRSPEFDGTGTNESGLNILKGGYIQKNAGYYDRRYYTYLWTSTPFGESRAWMRAFSSDDHSSIREKYESEIDGAYVRCIKDSEPARR